MGLTVRERKVLADIEQALAKDDPRLARQLSRMALTPAAGEAEEHAAEPDWAEEPRVVRRFARWCAALALVLLVASGVTASVEVLYGAGVAALAAGGGWVAARTAARHRE